MEKRRWLTAAMVVGCLGVVGCGEGEEEVEVPAGAIPAAPDVRPGAAAEVTGADTAAAGGAGAAAGTAGMAGDTL